MPRFCKMKNSHGNVQLLDNMKQQRQQQSGKHIYASIPSSRRVGGERLTSNKNLKNNVNNNNNNNLVATTTVTAEVNGNYSSSNPGGGGQHQQQVQIGDDKFEIPLPFGYHMDLDFLRFTSGESVSGETLERLKDLRKQRRKQRKTLEALMGIKQEQKDREKRIKEMVKPYKMSSSSPTKETPGTSSLLKILQGSRQPPPDVVNTPEFIRDALRDAVLDFEQCLERTKEDDQLRASKVGALQSFDLLNVASSTPKCSKFNTFPRSLSSPDENDESGERGGNGHSVTSTFKMYRNHSSNSSLSSISTASSAYPYHSTSDAVLAGLPSSIPSNSKDHDTDSITSITSEMSTHTLKNIREQMARSLCKLKEYESQVQAIPVMQVKLSVLKEEKRLLMLKLKQRELQLRREKGELHPEMEYDGGNLDYDTEDEDLDEKLERSTLALKKKYHEINNSRARSESPFARNLQANPCDFISHMRKRSVSCGYNSDSELISPMSERKYFESSADHRMSKSTAHHNLSQSGLNERSELKVFTPATLAHVKVEKKDLRDAGINTDRYEPPERIVYKERSPPPTIRKRDRAVNTDPKPRSPPPPRKVTHGTNTVNTRTMARGTGTLLQMGSLITKEELETRVQEAVFKTEEEIMGCPLLQKAMAKVEYEAIHGPAEPEPEIETCESGCQVGDENLRPFVISVALQCKLDETQPLVYTCDCQNRSSKMVDSEAQATGGSLERRSRSLDPNVEKLVRSVGVGDCKVIEDPKEPTRFREVGVCTEKWVEVIKASKQTDTEDFAFKDTESPRVADMVFEPSPERIVLERRSSLRRTSAGSPSLSRKSSGVASPIQSRRSSSLINPPSTPVTPKVITKSQGTMTVAEVKVKVPTKDVKIGSVVPGPVMKSVSTSAMMLALGSRNTPAFSSTATTPESEFKPPPSLQLSLCDKCNRDIHQVAAGIIAGPPLSPSPRVCPPSPDMPWLSKIPRPVPENPDVYKLKSATSTGNLSQADNRPRSPMMQRSKSNLTPTQGRKLTSTSKSPIPGPRPLGTPPPHPATPPVGSKRAPSPLARSQSPYSQQERRSLIPKLSPGPVRKRVPSPLMSRSTGSIQPEPESPPITEEVKRSLIPRVATPPALRKMYPHPSDGGDKLATPDRNVVRKNTFTKLSVGVSNPDLEAARKSSLSKLEKVKRRFSDIKERLSGSESDSSSSDEKNSDALGSKSKASAASTAIPQTAAVTPSSKGGFPLPGAALFTPIDENRTKVEPSKEMKAALKVLNDSISRKGITATRGNAQVTNAINIIQQEWFKISSTKQSNPLDVEEYLDIIEDMSKEVLERVVNLTDVNGNTALHYSVSHGNFDVVSVLLDSKVSNTNIMNKAGYTCTMLISLAQIGNSTHRAVVARLFSLGDVNVRATQHGQTALMLAVSHGRLDMVQLLVEAGADVNIRDEDGSTALMCAAEHGHMEIVKYVLQQPETNVLAKDNDGLTALAVAMEAGHRDVGVVLYANMSFSRGTSPYSSMRLKKPSSRTTTPTGLKGGMKTPPPVSKSPVGPTPPLRTRRNSSNQ